MKDELCLGNEPATLDKLIVLAIQLDQRLRERPKTKSSLSTNSLVSNENSSKSPQNPRDPSPGPMQLGKTRLTPQERQ